MAFVADTQVFTDGGWKKVSDISGHDRVLVRNFIGDAEFIQPFALKKKKYDGEILKIGAKDWSFSVTPDHSVVYDKDKYAKGINFTLCRADELEINQENRIYRKFNYIFSNRDTREIIQHWEDGVRKHTTVDSEDWYRLMGYVLCRGFIRKKPGRPMLYIFIDEDKIDQEKEIIGGILNRIGLDWHFQHSEKTSPKIVVSSKNTLAARLMTRLGSDKRKEMYLTDTILYNSTKELSKTLIETIKEASASNRERFQLVTTNKALIDSLTILGTLSGYSLRYSVLKKAGTHTSHGISKKDSYIVNIDSPTDTYAPRFIKRKKYSGFVYKIDLFDGQVYTKERSMPVWVNPQ